jgi:radical SAM protein with 4Fe4S-binding SPASM domain
LNGAQELPTEQMIALLGAAADSGCMMMTLSGGEPLIRTDFGEIYVAARRLGMIVAVFTNGSLIDDSHVELFKEFPPHVVEVSLYGATEETYSTVTGVAGVFRRVQAGIEKLVRGEIHVHLKSMILRGNAQDIAAMERMARDFGLEFRADPMVIPRLDGDRQSTLQRVEPDEVGRTELSLEGRRAELRKYVELEKAGFGSTPGPGDHLYQCGAGVASFHIDPMGIMRPCLMSRSDGYNALRLGFGDAWRKTTEIVEQAIWTGAPGCIECPDRYLCGYCAALFELEGASPERPPKYVCEIGKTRRNAAKRIAAEV